MLTFTRLLVSSGRPLSSRTFSSSSSLFASPISVTLNYQEMIPGRKVGRYIDAEDQGDMEDVYDPRQVEMHDARSFASPPTLEGEGFELRKKFTKVENFRDDDEVKEKYYPELEELIKEASGASSVFIFDHTVRVSGLTNTNTLGEKGAAAGSVARVHCDYTENSAPLRVRQLLEKESYTGTKLDLAEVQSKLKHRFAFINVWRSIASEPILTKPLAVCDTNSVDPNSRFHYHLVYKDRIGENYSLTYSPHHKWCYYPKMEKEECLVFKVFDSKEDGSRFVFHTAFDDPTSPEDAPARQSIEARTIAFFD